MSAKTDTTADPALLLAYSKGRMACRDHGFAGSPCPYEHGSEQSREWWRAQRDWLDGEWS